MSDLELPDLVARLRLDTSELDGAISKAAGVGAGIGSAVGNVAGGAIDSALGAITNFAAGSVDAFAQLEDATAAAGVLFGDNVGTITAAAEDAANRVGLSSQQYIDAAGTIGTFGKSAGLQGAPLTDFTTKLADLSGDLASFKGTSTEQAVEAVGAALRGESEPIRAYGVLLDEATIAQEAQRMGLVKAQVDHVKVASAKAALGQAQQRLNKVMHDGKATDVDKAAASAAVARAEQTLKTAMDGSTPALTKQQKLMATQSAILRQTSDAQGDFARTSDSTANTQKRLAAESANAQAQLGAKLAPALTALRLILLQLITGIGSFITFIQDNLLVLGTLAAVVGIATVALTAHSIITGVVSGATKAWTAAQAALNFVMSANPIALIVIAIALLVGAIVIAYQRSETFRRIVDGAMAGVRSAFETAMNAARTVVAAVMAFISGDVGGKMGQVRAVVGAVLGFLGAYFGLQFRIIRAVVSTVLGFVTSFIGSQLRAAQAIVSGVLDVIVGLFTGDFGRAKDGAVRALKGLISFVTTVPRLILSALGNLGGLLVDAGAKLMQGLADGIEARARAVVESVKRVAQRIKDFFPGSPVKDGPLTAWNNGAAGQRLGDLIVAGLDDSVGAIGAAASRAASAANVAVGATTAGQLGVATAAGQAGLRLPGGPTLVELTPATLAALAAAMPQVLLQVLLDSEAIAFKVDERLGQDASDLLRAG
jgi:hypothetical protein